MPDMVTTGALLQCTMGAAPAPLTVLPSQMVLIDNKLIEKPVLRSMYRILAVAEAAGNRL